MEKDEIELNSPPVFEIGQKVRVKKLIKNDGTFPGREIGEVLARIGDVGYVASIGTFIQAYYIYAVHFLNTGYIIGCRKRELESAEEISYESNATGK